MSAVAIATELRGLPVLSVRQPWPWFILHCGKDIENRSWRTHYRGRFLVHASKGMTRQEFADGIDAMLSIRRRNGNPDTTHPAFDDLPRGGIVGMADLVDCVEASTSPWFSGPFGFVLRESRILPFVPLVGQRGFFRIAA